MTSPTEALQAWLALEHEAVWLYPIIGARSDDLRPGATESFKTHRNTRDALIGKLHARGTEPTPALLIYGQNTPLTKAKSRTAAQSLESKIAAACLTLVGVTQGDARAYAVKNLTRAALAEMEWGAKPQAFPGLP